jgi:hypothetical protein
MDNSAKKRSSLKHDNLFPEGLSVEQFVEMNKNKTIKWDQKVIIEEETNAADIEMEEKKEKVNIEHTKIEEVDKDMKNLTVDPPFIRRRSSR